MEYKEYKSLDFLLKKLEGEIGHRVCVLPSGFGELTQIAVFDSSGEKIKEGIGYNIHNCVENLKPINKTKEI